MICPRCGNETRGVREGQDEFCTHCGGVLGPASTPVGGPGFDVDDLDQYIIVRDYPGAVGMFSLRRISKARPIGSHVAAHAKIEAVRVAIPPTHVRANVPVDGAIVEVWIDKRIEDSPKNLPPRRCPCGDMTINDCAGECGRMERR